MKLLIRHKHSEETKAMIQPQRKVEQMILHRRHYEKKEKNHLKGNEYSKVKLKKVKHNIEELEKNRPKEIEYIRVKLRKAKFKFAKLSITPLLVDLRHLSLYQRLIVT